MIVPRWMEGLQIEHRVGVPHFKPGQIRAWRDGDIAILRFVDALGRAWLVCLDRASGDWIPELAMRRTAGGLESQFGRPPKALRVTEGMRRALDAAEPFPPEE